MLSHPRGNCLLTEAGPCRSWLAGVGVGTWILGFNTGRDISPPAFCCKGLHISELVSFPRYKMAFRSFLGMNQREFKFLEFRLIL